MSTKKMHNDKARLDAHESKTEAVTRRRESAAFTCRMRHPSAIRIQLPFTLTCSIYKGTGVAAVSFYFCLTPTKVARVSHYLTATIC